VAGPQRRIPGMSFAQAAERHLDDVYGYLAWFTGDRVIAEDLAAETFERALRLWHRFDERRGSPRTWLCQLARTVALDHLRSERRRLRREERAALPERYDEPLAEGLSAELESALQALTAGEREVIALRVVLDLDAATAARVLGISTTNCTTRLARALKKLEEELHVAA
jgi:RNA polymerase sigma-70 factor, ECF subfamily